MTSHPFRRLGRGAGRTRAYVLQGGLQTPPIPPHTRSGIASHHARNISPPPAGLHNQKRRVRQEGGRKKKLAEKSTSPHRSRARHNNHQGRPTTAPPSPAHLHVGPGRVLSKPVRVEAPVLPAAAEVPRPHVPHEPPPPFQVEPRDAPLPGVVIEPARLSGAEFFLGFLGGLCTCRVGWEGVVCSRRDAEQRRGVCVKKGLKQSATVQQRVDGRTAPRTPPRCSLTC